MELAPSQQRQLLDGARRVIAGTLKGERPAPPCPDAALAAPGGCFVTLHERETYRLRGCVGRLEGGKPLWECVLGSAYGVLSDPRFRENPVLFEELPNLEIDISVLSPLRPAPSPLDFDPPTDGIYLHCGKRSGCFLPQVARETGWSREQLLATLCTEKMGLPAFAWQDPTARLETFSTLVIGPEPF